MKNAIVKVKDLGDCWSPARFCESRCARVLECHYPEKKTCKAVEAERKFIHQHYAERKAELEASLQSNLTKLE